MEPLHPITRDELERWERDRTIAAAIAGHTIPSERPRARDVVVGEIVVHGEFPSDGWSLTSPAGRGTIVAVSEFPHESQSMQTAKVATPDVGRIIAGFVTLGDEIDSAFEAMGRLRDRVEPMLGQSEPESERDVSLIAPNGSSIAMTVENTVDRLRSLRRELDAITSRVEL